MTGSPRDDRPEYDHRDGGGCWEPIGCFLIPFLAVVMFMVLLLWWGGR